MDNQIKASDAAAWQLGETTVRAVVHQRHRSRPTFLNVHDDEDTSVTAGLANLAEFGGRIIELVHTGERLISFHLAGHFYQFDPNRIFSEAGITATLERHSRYSPEAHETIRAFAQDYLARFQLNEEPLIISLHNATPGPFSVRSFLPGEYLARDAAAVAVSPQCDKYDFIFVTEPAHFEYLKARDLNVVLQDNERVTDDNSLSVHFARLRLLARRSRQRPDRLQPSADLRLRGRIGLRFRDAVQLAHQLLDAIQRCQRQALV